MTCWETKALRAELSDLRVKRINESRSLWELREKKVSIVAPYIRAISSRSLDKIEERIITIVCRLNELKVSKGAE